MWWIWLLRAIWTVLFAMGIIPNLTVIYCVFTRTPPELRSYSVLILDLAITESAAAFTNWFIMERMIPAPDSLNFVAYGPCVLLGPQFCFVAHSFMLQTYGNLMVVIPVSFLFRYYVLTRAVPKWQYIALLAFVLYIPGICMMVFLNMLYNGPDKVIEILDSVKYDDVINATDVAIYGLTDTSSWQNKVVLWYISTPWIPSYICAIVFRRKILDGIQKIGKTTSTKTLRLHATLVKALTLQACAPLIGIVAVATFAVAQVGWINHPALEMVTFMVTCLVPILNGSISVYFVPQYRSVVTGWFSCRTKTTPTITVVSSGLTTHG